MEQKSVPNYDSHPRIKYTMHNNNKAFQLLTSYKMLQQTPGSVIMATGDQNSTSADINAGHWWCMEQCRIKTTPDHHFHCNSCNTDVSGSAGCLTGSLAPTAAQQNLGQRYLYDPNALSVTQPTVSKHRRKTAPWSKKSSTFHSL